jgi:predicted GNAT family N-acyltransferase
VGPGSHFQIVAFDADDSQRMQAVRQIRQAVFCDEQGVSAAMEWDGKDPVCRHYLLSKDGTPLACARLRPCGPGTYKIERVAVLKNARGQSAGRAIMQRLMADAGTTTLVLNAQIAVEGFYQTLGFICDGAPFMEANIAHVPMVRKP